MGFDAASAYAATERATLTPEAAAARLYHAVVADLDGMAAALARRDFAALVRHGLRAQRALAAMHDLARRDTPEGERFRITHLWGWLEVGEVMRRHESGRLGPVRQVFASLAAQAEALAGGTP